ncbi:purple acid phosphatase 8-like isoform X2 [Gastrolobium bilobum]|uniref:purple acid phosphatase 8-like isoform X2 n=1 Tax=Gastrolobium bilobum TaxID=150636 RepID=UPI002AAFD73E|nr:purple acid phosphatase 8-like isoform X2 [Gastrolobium bilobum]
MRLLVFIATITLTLAVSSAVLQRFEQAPKPDGSLSFLVVGDWGRKGAYNQSKVAVQMAVIGKQLDIDFVISTGDNFYEDGLTGINDPAFDESFTKIYTAPSLQKQWYNVLGNHDYREVVEFFFVDTTPFVDKYFTEPKDHVYDWRGVLPRRQYISNLLKDVDLALKQSHAKWKIVVGHHTIRSAGHHGNTVELVKQLLPILEANNIDLYINGHDHCLEHISSLDSGIQFLTSGGGSKAWKGDIHSWKIEEMKLYYDGQGFMSVQVTETELDVAFYDVFGNVLHKWKTSKQLLSTL